jgi:hypothetical protein
MLFDKKNLKHYTGAFFLFLLIFAMIICRANHRPV